MLDKLSYSSADRRVFVKGHVASRAYEVDIHGVKHSWIAKFMWALGLWLLVMSLICLLFPRDLFAFWFPVEKLVRGFSPRLTGTGIFVIAIAAFLIGKKGKDESVKHAWVECKDTKASVRRAQVQKLASSIEDVERFKGAQWRPDIVMFVTSSRYDVDAIAFAEEHGFQCWVQSGESFKRVL